MARRARSLPPRDRLVCGGGLQNGAWADLPPQGRGARGIEAARAQHWLSARLGMGPRPDIGVKDGAAFCLVDWPPDRNLPDRVLPRRRRNGRGLSRPRKKLRRDVAIKVLPSSFTSDPDRLICFEREARMLATLNHPLIAADQRIRGG